ncbi:MAG: saccharopine dehydrogenase NADP-binding domain-containing protein [Anaerolineales bacterium]|nr:saccharopine dehydrogenase NADP-binding domain-containing protein [Anaerolineales bacterium]MCZ2121394.1 saccharopine dehydrogenase NADP-binding domain-containing protein [Anaerolineales bacterium]
MKTFLIYGSYGYTGKLIVEQAVKLGLKPILAGRDEAALRKQANEFNLEYRAFGLNDLAKLNAAVCEVGAVLHCAGPFSLTYENIVSACVANKKHYVDISGEIEEYEAVVKLDEEARNANIMLMPGGGFDVAPSDCLALYTAKKLPSAQKLELSIATIGSGVSRGTARSAIENMNRQGRIRLDGKIVNVPNAWRTKYVDFGRGAKALTSVGWGDVSTAFYSTKIPNIETYMALPKSAVNMMKLTRYLGSIVYTRPIKNFLKWVIGNTLPPGPSKARNQTGFCFVIAEVTDGKQAARAKLKTPEAYYLTSLTAVEIMKRILQGDFKAGFQTPSLAYGEDFILGFEGVTREDL